MSILEKVKVLVRNKINNLDELAGLYCERMDSCSTSSDHRYYEKELLINIEIRYELMDLLEQLEKLD